MHTAFFHGKNLWTRFRHIGHEGQDIHGRLMARFETVPWWWYAATALGMIGIGLGVTQGYPTRLSWWAFFVVLIMAAVWFVPLGIVKAATNVDIGLCSRGGRWR